MCRVNWVPGAQSINTSQLCHRHEKLSGSCLQGLISCDIASGPGAVYPNKPPSCCVCLCVVCMVPSPSPPHCHLHCCRADAPAGPQHQHRLPCCQLCPVTQRHVSSAVHNRHTSSSSSIYTSCTAAAAPAGGGGAVTMQSRQQRAATLDVSMRCPLLA